MARAHHVLFQNHQNQAHCTNIGENRGGGGDSMGFKQKIRDSWGKENNPTWTVMLYAKKNIRYFKKKTVTQELYPDNLTFK